MFTPRAASTDKTLMTQTTAKTVPRASGRRVRSRDPPVPPTSPGSLTPWGLASRSSRWSIAVFASCHTRYASMSVRPMSISAPATRAPAPRVAMPARSRFHSRTITRAPAAVTTMWMPRRSTGRKARAGPRHSVRLGSPRPPVQQPAERHVDERHGEHDQEAQDPRPARAETAGQLFDRQDHQEAQDVGRHQGRPEVGQQPAEGALPVAADLGGDRGPDAPHQTEEDHGKDEPGDHGHQEEGLTRHAEALEEEGEDIAERRRARRG